MDKETAIEFMKAGEKVTHRYFTNSEWVTMKDGQILTEEGYLMRPRDFWGYRQQEEWEEDWTLIIEGAKKAEFESAQLLLNNLTGNLIISFGNMSVFMIPSNPLYYNLRDVIERESLRCPNCKRIYETIGTCPNCGHEPMVT